MLIKNNSSRTVKVAIYNSNDRAQTFPLSGGAFNLSRGGSRNFNASRRVRVKFFIPGIFDQLITEAVANKHQNVTLGSNNRASASSPSGTAVRRQINRKKKAEQLVTSPTFLTGMARAASLTTNPNVQNTLQRAANRDRRIIEPLLTRQSSNIQGIVNSKAYSNYRNALVSGDDNRVDASAVAIEKLPMFERLAIELSGGGYDTYSITGGVSLSAGIGLDYSFGEYKRREPETRRLLSQKGVHSFGPSFGAQIGGSSPIQMCWFKDEPANLGGWCSVAVIGGITPLVLPLAVAFYYQNGGTVVGQQAEAHLIGVGIFAGVGLEISFATGWSHSWVE